MHTRTQLILVTFLVILSVQSAHAVTPGVNWKDSYSVGNQCYCDTTYDHETADIIVATAQGNRTVRQICERIGPGPGADGNPIYNDVQCGHGPPNNAIDEVLCPGRVDSGKEGCQVKGPTWNLDLFFPPLATQGLPPTPVILTVEPNDTPDATIGTLAVVPAQTSPVEQETEQQNTSTTNLEQQPDATEGSDESNSSTDENTAASTTTTESGGSRTQPAGTAIHISSADSKDNRWVLVTANSVQTAVGPDPDGPHTNSAKNGQYLELLPDSKVENSDVSATDNEWLEPGDGPQVHFNVDFSEAGQYAVYVRAFSTGEHDDTIHVGFDGIWPDSGADITTCGTRGRWIWSDCGNNVRHTITLPSAGVHSIQFAARDDGFEFDQFVLQRLDDSGNAVNTTLTAIDNENLQTQSAENGIPELGKAVVVGGSVGFGGRTTAFTLFALLLMYGRWRYNTIATAATIAARSDRAA